MLFYIIVIHDEDQVLMLILYSLYVFASNIYCNRYREHPRKIRPILDILQLLSWSGSKDRILIFPLLVILFINQNILNFQQRVVISE